MTKLQKLRKRSHGSSSNATVVGRKDFKSILTVNVDNGYKSLSKGQKKRAAKRHHVMQKLGIVPPSSVSSEAMIDPFLSCLESDVLSSNVAGDADHVIKSAATSILKSNKMKKSVAVREAARMKLVQQHPMFQADPLQAVNMHLQQMMNNMLQSRDKGRPAVK